jgi:hypothetical protein
MQFIEMGLWTKKEIVSYTVKTTEYLLINSLEDDIIVIFARFARWQVSKARAQLVLAEHFQ